MCISPITIINKNRIEVISIDKDTGLILRKLKHYKPDNPILLKDCSSYRIAVPCGHCKECIAIKQMYMIQRIQMESIGNNIYFATLTYDNNHLPIYTTSSGIKIRYADYHDIQLLMKRINNDNPVNKQIRYFAVTERGTEHARPHVHLLLFVKKQKGESYNDILNDETILYEYIKTHWATNVGTRKNPIYEPNFTFVRKFIRGEWKQNYDLHYVNPRYGPTENVAWYVLKYMLKENDHDRRLQQALKLNYSELEYQKVWQKVKSRSIMSKGFGLNPDKRKKHQIFTDFDKEITKYIDKGIDISLKDKESKYAYYFNNETGQTFPLAPYYKKRYLKPEQAFEWYYRDGKNQNLDTPQYLQEKKQRDESQWNKLFIDWDRIKKKAEELTTADLFDELI